MTRWWSFGWLATLLAAGCAAYTEGIRPDEALDARYAYLYGRSFIHSDAGPMLPRGQAVGFVIDCADGNRYTFGSIRTRDVQVLKVAPSRCWFIEAVMADQDGIVRKRLPVDRSLQRPLDFQAGRAHYLGDYFAKGNFHSWSIGVFTIFQWRWAMDPADDRYESTTAEMQRTFPNLGALPTIDERLIPVQERKRGNGLVAAPGEPPLSPERVARLAPLIKRNYGTPADCEAACPAGQCLPYRGESGPAIACVIYCDRDRDCPDGLACNCPNPERPEGPTCEPIATAPGDPMARICVSTEHAGQRR